MILPDLICNQQRLEATSEWKDLYSTNYPGDYNNDEDCDLLIESAIGVITLEIVAFNTERNIDYVDVYDGINDQAQHSAKTLHGVLSPQSIQSTGSSLFLKFISDGSDTRSGFHMRFKYTGYYIVKLIIQKDIAII